MRTCERAAPAGFTLLEVLAAVALLGILYVVLADVAMQGLLSEGRSRRRLEASLVADQTMSDVEIGLAQGTLPPDGVVESEEEAFGVAVEVRPFALTLPGAEYEAAPIAAEALGGADGLATLREIVVTVTWLEGEDEQRLSRTTFGYDPAAFALEAPTPGDEADARELTIDELEALLPQGGGR